MSTLHYMGRPGDTPLSAELARQICMRNNREAVLTGAISSLGRKYLLTLEAKNCTSGKEVAAAKAVDSETLQLLSTIWLRIRAGQAIRK